MKATSKRASVFTVRKYHGKSSSGALKVVDEHGRYFFRGECAPLKFDDGACVTASGVFPQDASVIDSGVKDSQPVQLFIAVGVRSKKLYLIRGKLTRTWPAAPKSKTRQPMPMTEYETEVQRIKAMQELGKDSMVTLPFVMRHCNRSAASVYRDIAGELFHKPVKRGSSSAWPFSAVEAYARGQLPGQGAASV